MKKIFMSVAAMAMVAVMASCGGNANNNEQKCDNACDSAKCEKSCEAAANCAENKCAETEAAEAAPAAEIDLSKKYKCPARCESSDEPGTCSQCGMDLEEMD